MKWILVYYFSESDIKPPMLGSDGNLIPLRNNAAGMMSGFEVILKGLISEYFPRDKRSKGYNVSQYKCIMHILQLLIDKN